METSFFSRYQHWIFAVVYALFFVFFIPWRDILGREFWDINNYLFRIAYLHRDGQEAVFFGVQWLLDEPLWKGIILAIGYLFEQPHYRFALYGVSFIALTLYGSFFFRRIEPYIIMILLINPLTVNLFIEQIRSALAFSLLLVAYDLSSRRGAIFLMVVASLIHAAMPIFIGIYFILHYVNQMVEERKLYLAILGVSFLMAFFMTYGLDAILEFLGDRHAGYNEDISGSSFAFSIFWFLVALVLSIVSDFHNEEQRIIIGYSILILSFFFFSSLLGGFAQRHLSLSLAMIIIAISYLPKHFKQGTYVALFAYSLLMFKYWISAG